MKIFITWTTSGIWNYLAENLKNDFEIIWNARSDNNIKWISFFNWDLTNDNFLVELSKNIGEIDYLIINAWIWYFDEFENISINQSKEIINTNLIAPIILTNLLLNKIKKWIIFIWSVSSKKSWKFWATYSASKFGLRWFAMNLKNEVSKIKIQLINPKVVKTNFHKNSKVEIQWKYEETNINEIFQTIKNILNWTEKRFEIDL